MIQIIKIMIKTKIKINKYKIKIIFQKKRKLKRKKKLKKLKFKMNMMKIYKKHKYRIQITLFIHKNYTLHFLNHWIKFNKIILQEQSDQNKILLKNTIIHFIITNTIQLPGLLLIIARLSWSIIINFKKLMYLQIVSLIRSKNRKNRILIPIFKRMYNKNILEIQKFQFL